MTGLAEWIADRVSGHTLCVVGVGNALRGDDGAGPLVIERLGGEDRVHRIDAGTTPENEYGVLLGLAPEVVLFVDAADLGARAGTCVLAPVLSLADRAQSTHAPSLRLLARLLAARRIECWLLGIQPACTAFGAPMSPGVRLAAHEVATALACVACEEAPRA